MLSKTHLIELVLLAVCLEPLDLPSLQLPSRKPGHPYLPSLLKHPPELEAWKLLQGQPPMIDLH